MYIQLQGKVKYSSYQKKNRTGNKNTSLYRGKVKNIREQKCRLLEWGPLGGWEGPLTIDIILDYTQYTLVHYTIVQLTVVQNTKVQNTEVQFTVEQNTEIQNTEVQNTEVQRPKSMEQYRVYLLQYECTDYTTAMGSITA